MNSYEFSVWIRVAQFWLAIVEAIALQRMHGHSSSVALAALLGVAGTITMIFAFVAILDILFLDRMAQSISIIEFCIFACWLAGTGCSWHYFTACDIGRPRGECRAEKMSMWVSTILLLLSLAVLLLQVAYVHIPSWREGVWLQFSHGQIYAAPPF